MNVEIANNLVQLRKKNGLSQEALADKIGVSRQAVSKWERSEASPDTDNLIALAKIYGVSINDLLLIETKTNDSKSSDKMESERTDDEVNCGDKKNKFNITLFPFSIIVVIVFLLLGMFKDMWHPAWLIFLTIPITESLIIAIKNHNATQFAYPVLTAFVFLCLGFFGNLWHIGWIVFLTIPVYYGIVSNDKSKWNKEV